MFLISLWPELIKLVKSDIESLSFVSLSLSSICEMLIPFCFAIYILINF